MLIGYARVSREEENIQLQRAELKKIGCDKIFSERVASTMKGKELELAVNFLKEGDVFVVCKLDRLGRNIAFLIKLVNKIKTIGANFISIEDQIDTTTPQGKSFFNFISVIDEFENKLLIERTESVVRVTRANGGTVGRPKKMTNLKINQAKRLLQAGVTIREVLQILDISHNSLLRYLPNPSQYFIEKE